MTVLLAATLLALTASTVEAPPSITNAKVEIRAGESPPAALARAKSGASGTWIGWSVAAIAEARDVCCFSDDFKQRGCSLASRDNGWGTSDRSPAAPAGEMLVLVETKDGAPKRVKIVSTTCQVDGAGRTLVWLGPVDAAASLAALESLLGERLENASEPALAAIAYHRDARADAILEKRVLDPSLPLEEREHAVFWAGEARGEAGFKLIDRVLSQEPDPGLRQHAVFALSQSAVPEAPERIKRVAIDDRDAEVRGHAYFSLSQTQAKGAGAWIVGRLDAEKNDHVRDQAIFALSQLHDGTDWLLAVLRAKKDPASVRHALFWLGQSDDPRALEEIEKILEK
ncbi:MAG TPA: HEAT repeat domain-containing protein [Candidatus Polarisedimenticolaceae bacterium]|nr:HEAT repeat domain-containing protein [Candidatus Polarisedimenticolaceae bacterium]